MARRGRKDDDGSSFDQNPQSQLEPILFSNYTIIYINTANIVSNLFFRLPTPFLHYP
jgi:hypothetical protein